MSTLHTLSALREIKFLSATKGKQMGEIIVKQFGIAHLFLFVI